MNICVYGAASNELDKIYEEKTEELGFNMAKRGHSLVFGGGKSGMMGAAARGTYKGGGKIIAVAPHFFDSLNVYFENATEFISTDTMRERKQILEDKSEAFVISPGGIGTFDEFFEILTLKSLGRHTKPIAVYNINGYFNPLYKMLETAVEERFMKPEVLELCPFYDDIDEMLEYIENYKGQVKSVEDMKSVK